MLTVWAAGDSYDVLHDQTLYAGSVLDNDWHSEMEPLTAALVSGPAQGTLNFGSGGYFSYEPPTHFSGTVSFTYSASFGGESAQATATINVTNNAPFAIDQSDSVLHDQALMGYVHALDEDGDALTYAPVSGPSHGTLDFNSDGSFSYTPDALYAGPDSFTFSVTDQIATDNGAFTINVTNNAPIPYDGGESGLHDRTLSSWLNAYDADGDTLTFALTGGPYEGTIVVDPSGAFTYIPVPGQVYDETFSFTVTDGIDTATGTYTVQVTNTAPETYDESGSTCEGEAFSSFVTAYDSDGDQLTYSLTSGAMFGSVVVQSDGSFTYLPMIGYTGTDQFSFLASDGIVHAIGMFTILVEAYGCVAGSPPTTNTTSTGGHAGTLREMEEWVWPQLPTSTDIYYAYEVYWGDGGHDWYFASDTPSHRYADDDPAGTPEDILAVSVVSHRWNGTTHTATANVTVKNVLPQAVPDSAVTNEDEAVTINVLSNDTDVSFNDRLALQVVSFDDSGTRGSVTYLGGGVFRYDPVGHFDYLPLNETATDTFTYQLRDDDDLVTTVTGTVTIEIEGRREAYSVSFSIAGQASEEGETAGQLTITLTPPAKEGGVNVDWTLVDPQVQFGTFDPVAATADDLLQASGTVFFAAGESQHVIQIHAKDDAFVEPDESAYITMYSIEDDDITISSNFAVMAVVDNEWRWVEKTQTFGLNLNPSPGIIVDGVAPNDTWEPHTSIFVNTSYVTYSSISKYTRNTAADSTLWTASMNGMLEFNLDPVTGVIAVDSGNSTGTPTSGPARAYADHHDVSINNDPANEHTVTFKIAVGAGFEGSFSWNGGTGYLDFGKDFEYSEEIRDVRTITLKARKGNS